MLVKKLINPYLKLASVRSLCATIHFPYNVGPKALMASP